jgi:hypothetical protein
MDLRGGMTMICRDVMLTYDRKERTFRFYADNREQVLEGADKRHAAFLLFENAMKERRGKNENNTGLHFTG